MLQFFEKKFVQKDLPKLPSYYSREYRGVVCINRCVFFCVKEKKCKCIVRGTDVIFTLPGPLTPTLPSPLSTPKSWKWRGMATPFDDFDQRRLLSFKSNRNSGTGI